MPKTIHVYSKFNDRVVGPLQDAFPEAEIVALEGDEGFAAGLPDAEFLMALKPPRGHWAKATNMKLLQSFGAGIDHLMPIDELPASVKVCNAAGLAAEPMSEYALTLILMCIKRACWAFTGHRGGYWRQYMPGSARGSTVCILGLGRIGEATAERCAAMGMRVTGTKRTPRPSPHVDKVYGFDQTAEAIADADVVVSILPLTDETHGILDEAMMRKMKPGSYVINLGRGGQVDEAALIKLLKEEHLAGAALDVAEQEPLPEGDPLWTAPNLIITPHVAGGFPDYMGGISRLFAENVRAFEAGQPLKTEIDRARGY
ncbi:MAG: D-2-hydroxyacid dehydrogenase [Minwuia sp.]|uniref:D-2-hydroxyacid dehydrogenase n=1 Tax=Minwuia sp. TaxID=2493630 RepID=UPI003A83DCB9